MFDAVSGEYLIEPIYDRIELVYGDGYVSAYTEQQIDLYHIESGKMIASIDRPKNSISVYYSKYGYLVFEIKDTSKHGVMDMSGAIIVPALYLEITLTPNDLFAVVSAEDHCSYVLDTEGKIKFTYDDIALTEYIPPFDSWLYSSDYFDLGMTTYGLLKSNGEIWVKPFMDSYSYFELPDWILERQPSCALRKNVLLFTRYDSTEAKWTCFIQEIQSASGFLTELNDKKIDWLPQQEIFVVINKTGDMGIVSVNGIILFEPRMCQIIVDEDYKLYTYLGSDFLLFTQIAQ